MKITKIEIANACLGRGRLPGRNRADMCSCWVPFSCSFGTRVPCTMWAKDSFGCGRPGMPLYILYRAKRGTPESNVFPSLFNISRRGTPKGHPKPKQKHPNGTQTGTQTSQRAPETLAKTHERHPTGTRTSQRACESHAKTHERHPTGTQTSQRASRVGVI